MSSGTSLTLIIHYRSSKGFFGLERYSLGFDEPERIMVLKEGKGLFGLAVDGSIFSAAGAVNDIKKVGPTGSNFFLWQMINAYVALVIFTYCKHLNILLK